MRYHEIMSGFRVITTSDEEKILKSAKDGIIDNLSDEYDQDVAFRMVGKGLLDLVTRKGKTIFKVSSSTDLWRE